MIAVSQRGGAFRIIPVLKLLNKESIRTFLSGAASRIISETLNVNKVYSNNFD
jgi:hypothetical protein